VVSGAATRILNNKLKDPEYREEYAASKSGENYQARTAQGYGALRGKNDPETGRLLFHPEG